MAKTVKLGFFGLKNREQTIEAAKNLHDRGVKVTAFFDKDPAAAKAAADLFPGALVCETPEAFLASGVTAAVLGDCPKGNPDMACALMRKGIAVLAGGMPARTLADCVKLCRTREQTGTPYMFAVPECFSAPVLEMKSIFATGAQGKAIFAEGEYIADGKDTCHGAPVLFYGTRALLPLLYITGDCPVRLTAKVPFNHKDAAALGCQGPDTFPQALIEMQSGAVYRIGASADTWPKGKWYRLGTVNGGMETKRGAEGDVWVSYFKAKKPEGFGDENQKTYTAAYATEIRRKYKDLPADITANALMLAAFLAVVRGEQESPFDVYQAAAMASVLLLACRSAVNDGIPTLLPDWKIEGIRKMYEYDFASPVPNAVGFATQPCRMKPID